jgi:hypothetical protein
MKAVNERVAAARTTNSRDFDRAVSAADDAGQHPKRPIEEPRPYSSRDTPASGKSRSTSSVLPAARRGDGERRPYGVEASEVRELRRTRQHARGGSDEPPESARLSSPHPMSATPRRIENQDDGGNGRCSTSAIKGVRTGLYSSMKLNGVVRARRSSLLKKSARSQPVGNANRETENASRSAIPQKAEQHGAGPQAPSSARPSH